jgi:hypothetical protein
MYSITVVLIILLLAQKLLEFFTLGVRNEPELHLRCEYFGGGHDFDDLQQLLRGFVIE